MLNATLSCGKPTEIHCQAVYNENPRLSESLEVLAIT